MSLVVAFPSVTALMLWLSRSLLTLVALMALLTVSFSSRGAEFPPLFGALARHGVVFLALAIEFPVLGVLLLMLVVLLLMLVVPLPTLSGVLLALCFVMASLLVVAARV